MSSQIDVEQSVKSRYESAAQQREAALCCPVTYQPELLKAIPAEILERDYGCGDPSPFVRAGDTVLDLGSGGGKLCYIASQIAGAEGHVIGVDFNLEMLALARKYQSQVAQQIGFDNTSFRCGMIQDLQLNLELLAEESKRIVATGVDHFLQQRQLQQKLRQEHPLIESDSVDCVVSNCVLNLVRPEDRRQLFAEVLRVLKNGGRAAISDIVADEVVPAHLRNDSQLWSGCISGAWREDQFLAEFERAGFHGVQIAKREEQPWQTVEGIEFRSVTVLAYKGKQGECLERNQALIYRGPFKRVEDDDGHTYYRGQRMAVCDKTFHLLQREPYGEAFLPVAPHQEIPMDEAKTIDCLEDRVREPHETKGKRYSLTIAASDECCGSNGNCC